MSSNSTMRFDSIKKKNSNKTPSKCVTVGISTTRVVSVRVLVNKFLRMKLGLWHCETDCEIRVPFYYALSEW